VHEQAGAVWSALGSGWMLLAALLVYAMNAGFALLEAGFCRSKNAVHALGKSFAVFAVAALAFWMVGFALMFGRGSDFVGASGFLFGERSPAFAEIGPRGTPLFVRFLFELAYCGIATIIISGAVAERIRFRAFLIFSLMMAGVIYPLVGHWAWANGGLLARWGFRDHAGATVVHSVGGWAALAGVLSLGPRIGKYRKDGSANPMPGHNMGFAALGGFILWLGWFGFNAGRTVAFDSELIGRVLMNTALAGATSTLSAMLIAWVLLGKPDLGMIINGTLGGLVAISAACADVLPWAAAAIGLIAGALVVLGVLSLDRLHIDDPVGGLSVHLLNGVFGTLAVGLLADPAHLHWPATGGLVGANPGLLHGGWVQLAAQIVGILLVGVFTFVASLVVWQLIRVTIGLRVGPAEELQGLDVSEMGMEAYPHDPMSPVLR